jgi:hypothetical protein
MRFSSLEKKKNLNPPDLKTVGLMIFLLSAKLDITALLNRCSNSLVFSGISCKKLPGTFEVKQRKQGRDGLAADCVCSQQKQKGYQQVAFCF